LRKTLRLYFEPMQFQVSLPADPRVFLLPYKQGKKFSRDLISRKGNPFILCSFYYQISGKVFVESAKQISFKVI